ncbi:NnrS family protein [Fodinibius saliphilus]|uniref:NnrS family protein n=1 Tax=Fodinibius saliphilus TaxID=1920650 RepID=UPI001109A292|nr:cbb3-type cytochrome c oxidase subunit I [Fodinibius saliphilus]
MPFISRIFIKSGMVYFVLSLFAGLFLEIEQFSFPALMPLFWHMLMLGWITQIIIGVSIWMYPGRNKEEGFWNQKWNWFTFIFLNIGMALRVAAEPMMTEQHAEFWNILIVISAVLHVLGGITYLIEIWPRIMSKKTQRKKRKRQRRRSS